MGTRSSKARDRDLTARQRERRRHVRVAESRGEALTEYSRRRGLSVSSLYEAKRRLRQAGLIPATRTEISALKDAKASNGGLLATDCDGRKFPD